MFGFGSKECFPLRVFCILFLVVLSNPVAVNAAPPNEAEFEQIFFSDFEDTKGTPSTAHEILTGTGFDDLKDNPYLGGFQIQYKGGNSTMRFARVVKSPLDSKNKVLYYSVYRPYMQSGTNTSKGRVQASMYNNSNIKELIQNVDLYLGDSLHSLKGMDTAFNWLTLFEFWNDGNWGGAAYPFRISIDITNQGPNGSLDELYFRVSAKREENGTWITLWEQINTDVPVPVEEFINTKIYFKEGKGAEGALQFSFKRKDGSLVNVFNVSDSTIDPKNPVMNGLDHFNPMKLYTSAPLVDHVRRKAKGLKAYWDNLLIKVKHY